LVVRLSTAHLDLARCWLEMSGIGTFFLMRGASRRSHAAGGEMRGPNGKADAGKAVSWLEAALQAGLGADDGPRPDLARQALAQGAPVDAPIEAWLEAVAAELASNAAVLIPDDMVEAVAARIVADRGGSLRAHARLHGDAVMDLLPKT
jgi:hypothetical protein